MKRLTGSSWTSTRFRAGLLGAALISALAPGVPAALADHTPAHTVFETLDGFSDGGTIGVYLKQVDGPVIEMINQTYVFEPASTIKALAHFHAFKQIEDGAVIDGETVELFMEIPTYQGTVPTCPQTLTGNTDTLSNQARMMMQQSHNPATEAVRSFFGADAINDTAAALGMDDSLWQHVIGCGSDAVANPNRLTLVDIGKLYEAVATGYLNEPNRTNAYNRMSTITTITNVMIDEEAAGLGMSSSAISLFRSQHRSAAKAGGYTVGGLNYNSLAGWVSLPFKNSNCGIERREFVWGAFIDAADDITYPPNPIPTDPDNTFSIWDYAPLVLRGVIREALLTWAACEADLEVVSVEVLSPPAEIDVNMTVDLTVRATVTNHGPAATVDAIVRLRNIYPGDCQGLDDLDVAVNNLAAGATVFVDQVFTVDCSQPCFHDLQFIASIRPANANVVDPVAGNNQRHTTITPALIARADLALIDWDFSALDDMLLGSFLLDQTSTFATIKTVQNLGDTVGGLYLEPVNGDVSRAIAVPENLAGSVVVGEDEAPASVTVDKPGDPLVELDDQAAGTVVEADGEATVGVHFTAADLEIGADRVIVEEFGVYCGGPGVYEIVFTNEIASGTLHVRDPDPSNNSVSVTREIECLTPVQINIRPGNKQNQVQPRSNQTIPVAILTTDEGEYGLPVAFDATTIDPLSVRFGTKQALTAGGGSWASPPKDFIRDAHEMDDKTTDGDLDMVLLFEIPDTGVSAGDTELCVVGKYLGEDDVMYTFFGCDAITTQP